MTSSHTRRPAPVHTILVAVALLAGWLPPGGAGHAAQLSLDPLGDPVSIRAYASLSSVSPGGPINLALVLDLEDHWHVNASTTNDEYLIPTSVKVEVPEGFEVRGIVYPEAVEKKLSFSENPLLLYEKEAPIGIALRVGPDVEPHEATVFATVTYQACDNLKCLAPREKRIAIPVRVSPSTEAIDATHSDIFSRIDFSVVAGPGDGGAAGGTGQLGTIIGQRGYFIAFLLVFVWGLALNLTPCVYPIIPITVGYFGGQSGGRSSRTFLMAGVYVLGMAAMYSSLGLFAALTGSLFGTALQNPAVDIIVASVMVGLALSMFGLYEIRVPMRLGSLAGSSASRRGWVGAFLMGLTVGIVAAPCIGPFVLALLTFVGKTGNPALGFSLFFTLAIGLGLPFLFLAVLSGSIARLPKSGEWMEWVKKLFGWVLIGMAVFFLQPLISDAAYYALMGGLFVVGGAILGFSRKKAASTMLFFQVFKRFVGVAAPLFGLYLILNPGHIIARDNPEGGVVWNEFDDGLLARAKASEQFVMIDFSAEWCLPCKELDHKTFSQQEVVDATADFVALKADLTQSASEEVKAIRKAFAIRGVPTVVFIDRNGKERKDLRVFGFVDKKEFLQRVDRLKSGT